jgi:D-cysteine desulfhydrase
MHARSPDRAPASEPARSLLQRFPSLAARLPVAPLCTLPTPVERARALQRDVGCGPLWVKRDDCTALPYGGNKARKLEWLLGRARAEGRTRVLTFGALGTNHGLATAIYAARLGLGCDLVLVDQPADERLRRRLRQFVAVGARLHYGQSLAGAGAAALAVLVRHPRTAVIPPGGSSPVGTLGFVDAGLELAEQIRSGELPEPARVYVPLGTGGTAAGLALGLALAGLGTRVVCVVVTDRGRLAPNEWRLRRLARRAGERLVRAGASLRPDALRFELELETGQRGRGYGWATDAAVGAVESASRAGLRLETTYTGKALAGLFARESGREDPVLFWNTYAASDPELELPEPRDLPRPFHRFFEDRT